MGAPLDLLLGLQSCGTTCLGARFFAAAAGLGLASRGMLLLLTVSIGRTEERDSCSRPDAAGGPHLLHFPHAFKLGLRQVRFAQIGAELAAAVDLACLAQCGPWCA